MEHNDTQKTINEINSTNSNVTENSMSNNNEKELLQKFLKNLLRLHPLILSNISLIGMIYYFAYFGFELRYFPDLGGSDVAYVGVSFFFITAFISLSIILPCLVYPGYYKNYRGWSLFVTISLLPFMTIVCMAALQSINLSKMSLIVSFFISLAYLSIMICIDKKTRALSLCCFIMVTIAVVILFSTIMYFFGIFNSKVEFLRTMLGFFIIPPLYFKGLEYFCKKKDYIAPIMAISIMIIVFLSWCFLGSIANRLGMTNVEYKYLSIEKSALGALPKGICEKIEKDSIRTYYDANDISNVVMLYNIKALSTLGKFYYLEAIGCENNEKIRFELDSSKIISRAKE
ncbi:hypothetical protein B9N63_04370 [Campylobacter concisus]|uniref:hypothetical protein n=1 Tax=Campylobacter concisus TaxID=199 RepID=UPI000B3D6124|nr:hypothetical protein [Campylobacter concisus]OUT14302.1 hypothetical protein B9N63_04370 [Campylobacter concisus]